MRKHNFKLNEQIDSVKLAEFIVRNYNKGKPYQKQVSDISEVDPFNGAINAWEVMQPTTMLVEVGSVIHGPDDPPVEMSFVLEPEDSGEAQKVSCLFRPKSELCRFLEGPVPKNIFCNPVTKQPIEPDFTKVCIYKIIVRNKWCSVPIPVAARLNFRHKANEELEDEAVLDEVIGAAGGVSGEFMTVTTTPKEGTDIEVSPIHSTDKFGCVNEFFTASMALINDVNLMNGIVEIPREVCEQVGLPVFKGVPEPSNGWIEMQMKQIKCENKDEEYAAKERLRQQFKDKFMEDHADKKPVQKHILIPINHLLAWPLADDSFAERMGMKREIFKIRAPNADPNDPGIVLYFIVTDIQFESMVKFLKQNWFNKVDMRPLDTVGVEFVPKLNREHYGDKVPASVKAVQGVCALRMYVSAFVPPTLTQAQINSLAPTRTLNFPSCFEWSNEQMEIEKQMAEMELEKQGGGEEEPVFVKPEPPSERMEMEDDQVTMTEE